MPKISDRRTKDTTARTLRCGDERRLRAELAAQTLGWVPLQPLQAPARVTSCSLQPRQSHDAVPDSVDHRARSGSQRRDRDYPQAVEPTQAAGVAWIAVAGHPRPHPASFEESRARSEERR